MPESHNERGSFPSDFLREVPKNFGILHLLGMRIVKAQAGVGQVSIQVDGRLMHPQQIVHGGVIFTIADTAMSMALMSVIPEGSRFGTIEAKVNFLLPVRSGELLAEGTLVHKGRSTAVVEATVYNIFEGEQQAIAKVLGTFYIGRLNDANVPHADQSSAHLSLPTTPLPPGTPRSALRELHFFSSQEDVEAMERSLEDDERGF
jgi:acyl-CoA thioesterase